MAGTGCKHTWPDGSQCDSYTIRKERISGARFRHTCAEGHEWTEKIACPKCGFSGAIITFADRNRYFPRMGEVCTCNYCQFQWTEVFDREMEENYE